jgi:hypothetical protein
MRSLVKWAVPLLVLAASSLAPVAASRAAVSAGAAPASHSATAGIELAQRAQGSGGGPRPTGPSPSMGTRGSPPPKPPGGMSGGSRPSGSGWQPSGKHRHHKHDRDCWRRKRDGRHKVWVCG